MARPADTLPCTICLWEGQDTPGTWRGLAPSSSWHYLCDRHQLLYGRKYSQLHKLNHALVHYLISTGEPFPKENPE